MPNVFYFSYIHRLSYYYKCRLSQSKNVVFSLSLIHLVCPLSWFSSLSFSSSLCPFSFSSWIRFLTAWSALNSIFYQIHKGGKGGWEGWKNREREAEKEREKGREGELGRKVGMEVEKKGERREGWWKKGWNGRKVDRQVGRKWREEGGRWTHLDIFSSSMFLIISTPTTSSIFCIIYLWDCFPSSDTAFASRSSDLKSEHVTSCLCGRGQGQGQC